MAVEYEQDAEMPFTAKKETSSVFEIVFLFCKKNCLTIMSTAFELVREYNLDHFFVVRFYIQIVGRLKLNKY